MGDDARHAVLLATIARAAGAKNAKPSDFSMAKAPDHLDPSDGKSFVQHVKKVLDAVKPRSKVHQSKPYKRSPPLERK